MSSEYVTSILDFKEKIESYVEQIFKYSSNELILRLEQLNLLNNKNNRLESSSAFGFIIEEFLVSKLDEYTIRHDGNKDYRVERPSKPTTISSYDCVSSIHGGIQALVNVKVCREGGAPNDAVAAIQQLYKDYVEEQPLLEKCFLVLKVPYSFCKSIRGASFGERAISVGQVTSYYLESVDLSKEHRQDNRQWSRVGGQKNSGRLLISEAFRKKHIVSEEEMSYANTVSMLKAVSLRNKGTKSES